MNIYINKKIVIIGAGKTGLSCINFFRKKKINVKIMDIRKNTEIKNRIPKGVIYQFGSLNNKWIMESNLIVLSPGVPIGTPIIQKALCKGIEIIGDIEIFCKEVKKPIIAITGTNGKTTVTKIVGNIIKSSKLKVGIGGNIGKPALNLLYKKYDIYVLEISSFQLETTKSLKATVAVVLNLQKNHIDRYNSFKQYCKSKLKIFSKAKICIFNKNEKKTWPKKFKNVHYKCFGIDSGEYRFDTKSKSFLISGKKFLDLHDLKLKGVHNYVNILAAIAVADSIGIPTYISMKSVKKIKNISNRFQFIGKKMGATWINDSKSTNISSTLSAIKSIDSRSKIYLILGGKNKSSGFSALKKVIEKKNVQLCCFGTDGIKFSKLKKNSFLCNSLEECINFIRKRLNNGEIVLFSPACSSFDQFENFAHRGNIFLKLYKSI
ncbi:hypothetical protein AOQ88_01825 [Candidatus Riesia sp. GBBU]|nr:hypothetical protein AOQ88_01825 [Candidatus Riesia sp. GBBU]